MREPRALLIAWHSQSGTCARLAAAAQAGAATTEGPGVRSGRCDDLGSVELAAAGGLLLITAENSGRLAGGANFLDRCFYPAIDRGLVLPYALLVSAGNDGRNAVAEAERIFRGIPFTAATEPLILRGLPGAAELEQARELGEAFATGLSLGIF